MGLKEQADAEARAGARAHGGVGGRGTAVRRATASMLAMGSVKLKVGGRAVLVGLRGTASAQCRRPEARRTEARDFIHALFKTLQTHIEAVDDQTIAQVKKQ